jgi:hypothetical protein
VRLRQISTSATNRSLVPAPDDICWWMWNGQWNENWQEKPQYSGKTCPSASLSISNPTWPRTQAAEVGIWRLTALTKTRLRHWDKRASNIKSVIIHKKTERSVENKPTWILTSASCKGTPSASVRHTSIYHVYTCGTETSCKNDKDIRSIICN